MRICHHLLLMVSVCMLAKSRAQDPNPTLEIAKMQFQAKQVIPPAPEAAELGKYGNVPISLFTGTPNISIPLFELKGANLSLPISISYNASGYKPEDLATWVGSGWTLNAGGVITRSAQGNPDTDDNYFEEDSVLTPPSVANKFGRYTYMYNVQDGTKETRPDVYYYNFAGHSGKFYLKPDETVLKKDYDLKKITPGTDLVSFTIVDEQGITYEFQTVETTKMVPNDDEGNPSMVTYNFPSAWYLTAMYNAAGDAITFTYHTTSEQIIYQNMLQNKSSSLTYGTRSTCGDPKFNFASVLNRPGTTSITRKFLKAATLSRATLPVAYVEMISATGQRLDSVAVDERVLNTVKISSIDNDDTSLVKQYDFKYGYFSNTGNASYKKRLRLDSLRQVSVDAYTPSPPAYVFTYNTSFDMPERFTAALDHWGFFNASGNTTSLVPYVAVPAQIIGGHSFPATNVGDGADREPSLAGSSAGILTKMQYPTGGYTEFEYELNQARFYDSTIHSVGGVRIKRMIDYSFENKKAVVKDYSYLRDDGTTSGVAGIFPEYKQATSYTTYVAPLSGCLDDYTLFTITVSANSIFGLGSIKGAHVGYKQVTETQTDLTTSQPLGKTIHKFQTGVYDEFDDDIANGDLLEETVYRNDGKIMKQTKSTYQYTTGDHIDGFLLKSELAQTNKKKWCRTSGNAYLNYGEWTTPDPSCVEYRTYLTELFLKEYNIWAQNKRLTKQEETIFDQLSNSYLTATKKFTYSNPIHNYPTLLEEVASTGERVFTSMTYPPDYDTAASPASGSIADHIKTLQTENITGVVIEKLQYRGDSTGSNRRYLSGQITDYVYSNPVGMYFLEAKPLLTSVTSSSIVSNSFTKDSRYRLVASLEYDNAFNLTQQAKTNDVLKSYIWDYRKTYPIAEITGATSSQVAYTSFESDGKGRFTFSGIPSVDNTAPTGRKCYNLTSQSVSGTADPSKAYVVSYWRKNSTTPFTVTGSTGTIQGITRNGWTYIEHRATGNSTITLSGSGYIDEVRMYPATAQISTLTFTPLIGISGTCNENSRLAYYEYDGLSRLIAIRDADGALKKRFRYNYGLGSVPIVSAQSLFYNAAKDSAFGKTGCTGGAVPDTVLYKIPYGKYASAISQYSADSLAILDFIANGQAYANANAHCRWRNTEQWQWFFKNDCTPDQGPGIAIKYIIPAGSYFSLISQSHADSLAMAVVLANGQAYANANSTCSCVGEGKKWVNNECEQGDKVYIDFTYNPTTGLYTCRYRYTFSDSSVSQYYFETRNTPCPEND